MVVSRSSLRAIAETFVNREYEIGIVEERVDIIRYGGTVFQAVINFFGVVGIGKTMLVQETYKRMRAYGTPCALVDFARDDKYRHLIRGPVTLLEDVAASVANRVELQPLDLQDLCASFWKEYRAEKPEPALVEQRDRVTEAFLDYADRLLRHLERVPMVLLFDTTEAAEQEVLDWLEREIFIPLLRTERVVIVIAGRVPWRLKEFQVRRRTYQYRLQPFGKEMAEKQLRDYRRLTPKIIEVTFGHPDANRRVVERVYELEQTEGPLDSQQFDAHKAELVGELVKGLIDDRVLADLPVEVRQALHLIAPLRQFDVSALRSLLIHFLPKEFEDKSGHYFLTMIRRMVETTVVQWDSARKGYALDPTARRMLALNMQLHRQEDFVAVHEEAIALYNDWTHHIPEARSRYMIEKLYHTAEVLRATGEPGSVIGERLAEELLQYLQEFYGGEEEIATMAGLERLVQEFNGDEELDQVSGGRLETLINTVKKFQPALT